MIPDYRNEIYESDLLSIKQALSSAELSKLNGSSVLVTGCAGFLGFYMLSWLHEYRQELGIRKLIGVDNFRLGRPGWLDDLQSPIAEWLHMDIAKLTPDDLVRLEDADYVVHMASIASPTFYRQYPIETVDANVWGLRGLLELFKSSQRIRGFLFFSSSEVYGDPPLERIPTAEDYRGNVQTIGPRACYDEAKRFGETLCYLYSERYGMPITIVRPFNNYGPGMRMNDRRVPADFAKAVLRDEAIRIYSDGTPTRTFCYVTDAVSGYLKALLHGSFDVFNIGMDRPELSVSELARIYQQAGQDIVGRLIKIEYGIADDSAYLTHNPSRRCPDLTKAKELLQFKPIVDAEAGVRRYLTFLKQGGVFE